MSVITFPRRVDTAALARAPDPKRVRRLFRKSAAVRRTSRPPAPSRSHAHVAWGVVTAKIVRHRDLRARAFNGGRMVVAIVSRTTRAPESTPPVAVDLRRAGGIEYQSRRPQSRGDQAGALHLVYPVSVTQVPSTSLDEPLRLPKFLGYAPATSGRFGEHALFADSHAHPGPAPPRASTRQWSATSRHAPVLLALAFVALGVRTLLPSGRRSRALRPNSPLPRSR